MTDDCVENLSTNTVDSTTSSRNFTDNVSTEVSESDVADKREDSLNSEHQETINSLVHATIKIGDASSSTSSLNSAESKLEKSGLKENTTIEESKNDLNISFYNYITFRDNFYFCNLCRKGFDNFQNVIEHTQESEHCSIKMQFNDQDLEVILPDDFYEVCVVHGVFPIIRSQITKYKCFTCNTGQLTDKNIKPHTLGKTHENKFSMKKYPEEYPIIFDNSRSLQCFITCFENSVVFYNNLYYCYLCNKIIEDSFTSHIKNTEHQSLKRSSPVKLDKNSWIYEWLPYNCEQYCTGTVVMISQDTLCCLACNKISGCFVSINKHMKKLTHENEVRTFFTIDHLNKFKEREGNRRIRERQVFINQSSEKMMIDEEQTAEKMMIDEEQTEEKRDEIESEQKLHEEHLITADATELMALEENTPIEESKNNVNICFNNYITFRNNFYFCNLCRKGLDNFQNVIEHTQESKHCSVKMQFNDRDLEGILPDDLYEVCVVHGVFPIIEGTKKSRYKYRCFMCDIQFRNLGAIHHHVAGLRHKAKFNSKEYLKENSSAISDNLGANDDRTIEYSPSDEEASTSQPTKQKINFNDCNSIEHFVTCFENSIVVHNCLYYCYLCDKIIEDSIIPHIEDKNHRSLKNSTLIEFKRKSWIYNLVPNYCEKLCTEDIVMIACNELYCLVCERTFHLLKNFNSHFVDQEHQRKIKNSFTIHELVRRKTGEKVSNEESMMVEEHVGNEVDKVQSNDAEDFVTLFKNSIAFKNGLYCCYLCCDNFVDAQSALTHTTALNHQLLFERKSTLNLELILHDYQSYVLNGIVYISEENFKCIVCNSNMIGICSINEHIRFKNHLKATGVELKNNTSLEVTINELNVCFDNYITIKDNIYYCNLCQRGFGNFQNLICHMEELKHISTKLKYRKHVNDLRLTDDLYKICVFQGIYPRFSKRQERFRCFMCNNYVKSYGGIQNHAHSATHKYNFNRKMYLLENSMKMTSNGVQNASTEKSDAADKRDDLLNSELQKTIDSLAHATIKIEDTSSSTSSLNSADSKLEESGLKENTPIEESKNDLNICFNNYITFRDNFYFCNLCRKGLDNFQNVIDHTQESEHCSIKMQFNDQDLEVILPDDFYEVCVVHGVFPIIRSQITKYKCFTCNTGQLTDKDIKPHTLGKTHENKFSMKKCPEEYPIIFDNSRSLQCFITCFENSVVFYNNLYYCYLCNKIIEDSFTAHIKNTEHQSLERSSPVKLDKNSWIYEWLPYNCEQYCTGTVVMISQDTLCCLACNKISGCFVSINKHMKKLTHENEVRTFFTIDHLNKFKEREDNRRIRERRVFINQSSEKMMIDEEQTAEKMMIDEEQTEEKRDEIESEQMLHEEHLIIADVTEIMALEENAPSEELKSDVNICFNNYVTFRNNFYFCNLCRKGLNNFQNVIEHTQESEHSSVKMQFNDRDLEAILPDDFYEVCVFHSVFPVIRCLITKYKCFTCNTGSLNDKDIKPHTLGKTHQNKLSMKKYPEEYPIIFDNSRSLQCFITSFENSVVFYNNLYYCYLCNKIIEDSVTAHIKNTEHQTLKRSSPVKLDKNSWIYELAPYHCEQWCTQTVVVISQKKLYCLACSRQSSTFLSINQHLKKKTHKKNVQAFFTVRDLNKFQKCEVSRRINEQQELAANKEQTAEKFKNIASSELEYFVLFKNSCVFYNGFYFCRLCSKNLSHNVNVALIHTTELNHQLFNNRKTQFNVECTFDVYKNFVFNSIVHIDGENFCCTVCCCYLTGFFIINEHILGEKHVEAMADASKSGVSIEEASNKLITCLNNFSTMENNLKNEKTDFKVSEKNVDLTEDEKPIFKVSESDVVDLTEDQKINSKVSDKNIIDLAEDKETIDIIDIGDISSSNSSLNSVEIIMEKSSIKETFPIKELNGESKICFNDYISINDNIYFCNLCRKKLRNFQNVFDHIQELEHRRFKRPFSFNNRNLNVPQNLYEICNSQGIFPIFQKGQKKYRCFKCKCNLNNLENVEPHTHEMLHQNKFCEDKNPRVIGLATQRSLTCFGNAIIVDKKANFCYLCSKFFKNSVDEHVEDEKHQSMKRTSGIKVDKDSWIYDWAPSECDRWCSDGIVMVGEDELRCIACNKKANSVEGVDKHVRQKGHKRNIKNFFEVQQLIKLKEVSNDELMIVEGHAGNELDKVQSNDAEDFVTLFKNSIAFKNGLYCCYLCCDNFVDAKSALTHTTAPNHQLLFERKATLNLELILLDYQSYVLNGIVYISEENFKCIVCNSNMTGICSINEHICFKNHLKATGVELKNNTSLEVTINELNVCFDNYITIKDNIYYCNLCQRGFGNFQNLICHMEELIHISTKLKYIKRVNNLRLTDDLYKICVYQGIFPRFSKRQERFKCFMCNNYVKSYGGISNHAHSATHKYNFNRKMYLLENSMKRTSDGVQNSSINLEKSSTGVPIIDVPDEWEDLLNSAYQERFNALTNAMGQNGDTSSSTSSLCRIESKLMKLNSGKSGINACREHEKKQRENKKRRRTVLGMFVFCNICDEKFMSFNQLHEHASIHFAQYFGPKNPVDEQIDDEVSTRDWFKNDSDEESTDVVVTGYFNKPGENVPEIIPMRRQPRGNVPLEKLRKSRLPKVRFRDLDVETDEPKINFDIYKIDEEQLKMIKFSINRCIEVDENKMYCLICRQSIENVPIKMLEHFRDIDHNKFLWQMIVDDFELQSFAKVLQFSDLQLARESMEEISDETVHCYACNTNVINVISSLKRHLSIQQHHVKREQKALNDEKILEKLERNWYNSQGYWCIFCNIRFSRETRFVAHLMKNKHKKICKKFAEHKELIFDYCPTCITLIYGTRETFAYHRQSKHHKYYRDKPFFTVSNLSATSEQMLNDPDSIADKIVESLDTNAEQRQKDTEMIIEDLETIISQFIEAKAWPFGSRISGLGSDVSDLDIFLDCNNRYHRGHMSDNVLEELKQVENILKLCNSIWTIQRTITNCRVPIIKLNHITTGVECDVSFTNGLTYENTQLLKTILQKLPLSRKLILFIKQWIQNESLSGTEGISSYAIAWMVIYYLQTKFMLPTIITLIEQCGESKIIGGWEVGVNLDFDIPTIDYNFKMILKGFFKMYGEFDYRNNIICPLLGEPIKKEPFVDPINCLPDEMDTYKRHVGYPYHQPLCVDSTMVVQDPLDLSHNITKAVDKVTVNKFRKLCLLSAKKLDDDYKLYL